MSSRAERSEGEWKDVDHLAIAVDPLSLKMGQASLLPALRY